MNRPDIVVAGLDVHKDSVCFSIRGSNYVSTVDSKSYKKVAGKLSEGITDAVKLLKCIHGRTVYRCTQ